MAGDRSQSTVGSITVVQSLLRTRAVVAYAILLVCAPVLVAFSGWQSYQRTQRPDVGLAVDGRLEVEGADERWPGVERGDQVVALDGEVLPDGRTWIDRALSPRELPLVVTFARDGATWTATAAATPLAPLDELSIWARVITGALLMAMGLVAFILRPGVPVTWLLLLLSWDVGAFVLLKPAFWWDPYLSKATSGWAFICAVAFGVHFMSYFPQQLPWTKRHPRRAVALYVLPVLAVPIVAVWGVTGVITALGTFAGALAGVGLVSLVVSQARRLRNTRSATARAKYRALIVAFALGVALPAVWNFVRLTFGVGAGPWSANYNALPLLLFVGVVSYAVVRHNALAIDKFTAAVVGYGLTVVLLGSGFFGALVGLPLLLDEAGFGSSRPVLVAVTALTFASFSPLYRRIRGRVDQRFFREQADAVQIAETLRDLVLTMQQSPREEAIQNALEAVGILGGEQVELWLLDRDTKHLVLDRRTQKKPPRRRRFSSSFLLGDSNRPPAHIGLVDESTDVDDDDPISADGPLGQALRSGQAAGVEGLAPRLLDTAAQEELWACGLAMVAPVMIHGVVAGFLGLGRKRSGVGFQPEELSFVSIVGAQLGSALERSQGESSRLDRYHLEHRLGTGGMAEVHLAWQVGPGGFERRVAIKRPLPHVAEDPNAVASFLDEARLAAQLRHANIAQVYDVGESDGSYFIVMEYVDGPSLRQILRGLERLGHPVPLEIACGIVNAVLDALEYAHTHRDGHNRPLELVHRDVTPRNVLLNRRGEAKLVDFGIARAQHQLHVTRTGTVKGTLPYMSPEQAGGLEVDCRGDIYSAAAVLYELLTGIKAYPDGPTRGRPPSLGRRELDLPLALDPVLARAMAFAADARYATASDLAKAVRLAIHPVEPADAHAVGAWLREIAADIVDPAPHSGATAVVADRSGSAEATMLDHDETAATVVVGRSEE